MTWRSLMGHQKVPGFSLWFEVLHPSWWDIKECAGWSWTGYSHLVKLGWLNWKDFWRIQGMGLPGDSCTKMWLAMRKSKLESQILIKIITTKISLNWSLNGFYCRNAWPYVSNAPAIVLKLAYDIASRASYGWSKDFGGLHAVTVCHAANLTAAWYDISGLHRLCYCYLAHRAAALSGLVFFSRPLLAAEIALQMPFLVEVFGRCMCSWSWYRYFSTFGSTAVGPFKDTGCNTGSWRGLKNNTQFCYCCRR